MKISIDNPIVFNYFSNKEGIMLNEKQIFVIGVAITLALLIVTACVLASAFDRIYGEPNPIPHIYPELIK